jgi:hypothetical protein
MQFFVLWISFLGLVFVSMLHSVVCDLNAVSIPNISPILLFFFRYPPDIRYYQGILRVFLVGRFLLLAMAQDFIHEFWWVAANVTLKVAYFFFRISSLMNLAVALLSRHLTIPCLLLCG